MRKDTIWVIVAGAVLGVLALILTKLGNPVNMGFCMACFERDIVGALGFFNWEKPALAIRYIRPEIIGIVIGGFVTALAYKEFKPQAGSAPVTRFILGMFMMIGALAFLGCPTRMIIRLAGGDLNAVLGVVGFAAGIFVGVQFLKQGFNLGRTQAAGKFDGWLFPLTMLLLLGFALMVPKFIDGGPILVSAKGHVGAEGTLLPGIIGIMISLIAGLVVGFLGQRSRLCFAGGVRDLILMRSMHLVSGIIAMFVIIVIGNVIMGNFGGEGGLTISFDGQSVAHTGHVWNFLGMALVGMCATLLGGCPFRQLILAGNGNTDSVMTVVGMFAGAAVAHNFGLVKAATLPGQIAVVGGLVLAVVIALMFKVRR